MRVVYFDCFAGISGDMILGSLIDAGADRAILDATLASLRLRDEVRIEVRNERRGHLGGTRVLVNAENRAAREVPELRSCIEDAKIPDQVKERALQAFDLLSGAESRLHDVDELSLHLHELGGADTLIDLVGGFWLLHASKIERVYASPLPAPRGMVGDMPLPAPASVRVLAGTGAVFVDSEKTSELVTPTGAAVLASCASFERPAMKLHAIGYGIGARELPGNALAAWVGDEVPDETGVTVIETNIDDLAPNLVAALAEDLMAAGALDVTVTPALMKKGRLGQMIAVMSAADHVSVLTEQLLRQSSTLGVRMTAVRRVITERRIVEVETRFGRAHVKVKEFGGKAVDVAPEFDDVRRLSTETGRGTAEVMRAVADAARKQLGLV